LTTAINGCKSRKLPPWIVEKGLKELKSPSKPSVFLRFNAPLRTWLRRIHKILPRKKKFHLSASKYPGKIGFSEEKIS
jgi:hypothetical protein